jgi:hypothetical protein
VNVAAEFYGWTTRPRDDGGTNTGSNPVGDAKSFNRLRGSLAHAAEMTPQLFASAITMPNLTIQVRDDDDQFPSGRPMT